MNRTFNPHATPAGSIRVLFRCPVKKCKYCKAAHVPFTTAPAFVAGSAPRQVIAAGEIAKARLSAKCQAHPSAFLELAIVHGTHSDAFQCDPRCTAATGPICVCSCGGANHGCDHL